VIQIYPSLVEIDIVTDSARPGRGAGFEVSILKPTNSWTRITVVRPWVIGSVTTTYSPILLQCVGRWAS